MYGQMLLEGMACEKSEENRDLGLKFVSLAADKDESNALFYLFNICAVHGDQVKVRALCKFLSLAFKCA